MQDCKLPVMNLYSWKDKTHMKPEQSEINWSSNTDIIHNHYILWDHGGRWGGVSIVIVVMHQEMLHREDSVTARLI
jgi:hypothetical protein